MHFASAFSLAIRPSNAASVVSAGSACNQLAMPACSNDLPVADIDLAGRIVAEEHGRQPGTQAVALKEPSSLLSGFFQ